MREMCILFILAAMVCVRVGPLIDCCENVRRVWGIAPFGNAVDGVFPALCEML